MRLGALEAGGTKMVCSIGDETGKILDRATFPTLSPAETLPPMIEYFRNAGIEALGISSFGPLDLNPASPTYGYVTTTPKPGWGDCPLLPEFQAGAGRAGGHRYRRGRRGAGGIPSWARRRA